MAAPSICNSAAVLRYRHSSHLIPYTGPHSAQVLLLYVG